MEMNVNPFFCFDYVYMSSVNEFFLIKLKSNAMVNENEYLDKLLKSPHYAWGACYSARKWA